MNRIENNIEGMKMSTEGKFLRSKTWDQKPTQNNFNCEDKGWLWCWGKAAQELSLGKSEKGDFKAMDIDSL